MTWKLSRQSWRAEEKGHVNSPAWRQQGEESGPVMMPSVLCSAWSIFTPQKRHVFSSLRTKGNNWKWRTRWKDRKLKTSNFPTGDGAACPNHTGLSEAGRCFWSTWWARPDTFLAFLLRESTLQGPGNEDQASSLIKWTFGLLALNPPAVQEGPQPGLGGCLPEPSLRLVTVLIQKNSCLKSRWFTWGISSDFNNPSKDEDILSRTHPPLDAVHELSINLPPFLSVPVRVLFYETAVNLGELAMEVSVRETVLTIKSCLL